mmetsp:Transcript_48076/g.108296  ORF Transcript_48076/g.108296 Transcript_48076/m.108296 type:complete len:336 (-) Transcript_48076:127-1134(-)
MVSLESMPDLVLANIFGRLAAAQLRAVPLVCSAWHVAERLIARLLWARFAPGWPPDRAKQVVVRSLLFDMRHQQYVDVDALALEALCDQTSTASASQPNFSRERLCAALTRPFCGLPPFNLVGTVLDALAPRRFKCLITGPKASGKTAVLDTLCGRPGHYAERRGSFHVEMLMVGGVQVQLWEGLTATSSAPFGAVGSYGDMHARSFLEGTDGLIYVCDGRAGTEDAAGLQRLLDMPDTSTLPLLIIASKQDLTPRSPAHTAVSLGLLAHGTLRWRVQPCCLPSRAVAALRGLDLERDWLHQGMRWLVREMRGQSHSSPSKAAHGVGSVGRWLLS